MAKMCINTWATLWKNSRGALIGDGALIGEITVTHGNYIFFSFAQEGPCQLTDTEILQLVASRHIPAYKLETALDNHERGVRIRRRLTSQHLCKPSALNMLPYTGYDYTYVCIHWAVFVADTTADHYGPWDSNSYDGQKNEVCSGGFCSLLFFPHSMVKFCQATDLQPIMTILLNFQYFTMALWNFMVFLIHVYMGSRLHNFGTTLQWLLLDIHGFWS